METRFERRQATRKRLVDAAVALLTVRSFERTTIDEISEKAGFSKGAFYFHFESKEAMLIAMIKHLGELDLLWPPLPEKSPDLGLTRDQLEHIIFEIWFVAREQAEILELIQSFRGAISYPDQILDLGWIVQHQLGLPSNY